MVIFHGELLVITRWYVNKRPTIMRHFPEHKPLETVSGLNLKNPWFCRVSDSPVHRCWTPNIVNSSGIIVTSSNSQMNPLPIGVLKVDFHGCVFSSLLQVMQNKQHCTVTGCFLTMSMTVIDWLRPHNVQWRKPLDANAHHSIFMNIASEPLLSNHNPWNFKLACHFDLSSEDQCNHTCNHTCNHRKKNCHIHMSLSPNRVPLPKMCFFCVCVEFLTCSDTPKYHIGGYIFH